MTNSDSSNSTHTLEEKGTQQRPDITNTVPTSLYNNLLVLCQHYCTII